MGTARQEHRFQFPATVIAQAADTEAKYHEVRHNWWTEEYRAAVARVKATASVEIKTFLVTGGERADVVVNYGDPAAYKRMGEAFQKIQEHRQAAGRYRSDAHIYNTQGERTYELDADDVAYFRLGGEARPA